MDVTYEKILSQALVDNPALILRFVENTVLWLEKILPAGLLGSWGKVVE